MDNVNSGMNCFGMEFGVGGNGGMCFSGGETNTGSNMNEVLTDGNCQNNGVTVGCPGAVVTDENTCVLCFKNVDIYSIGDCDHPVCFECSTRMRVLCQQNECPICRHGLSKVIFTEEKLPFRQLESQNCSEFYNKKYKIGFCNVQIKDKFYELLSHPCPKCSVAPYRTFQGLRGHVRKMHNMLYCDLCVDHLNIFTFERRCYTERELTIHLSKGDSDNRSHRGHPLCEYCNKRYLDRDELFRHLRREHYFCHFCEADGTNEFYGDYDNLADHFRQHHFLCEEGKCATEKFTGAFRTEIDFKAHVANVHGNLLNKQQAKQTRTLQLEITLGLRTRSGHPRSNDSVATVLESVEIELNETGPSYSNRGVRTTEINACDEEEFPALRSRDNNPLAIPMSLTRPPPASFVNRSRVSGLARTQENFPSLSTPLSNNNNSNSKNSNNSMWSSLSKPSTSPSSAHPSPTGNVTTSEASSSLRDTRSHMASGTIGKTPNTNVSKNANGGNSNNNNIVAAGNHNQSPASKKKSVENEFPALPATKSAKKPIQSMTNNGGAHHNPPATLKSKPIRLMQEELNTVVLDSRKQNAAMPSSSRAKPPRVIEDEDMIPLNPRPQYTAALQTKHRNLVDDYVSEVDPATLQKIQLIKLEDNTNSTEQSKMESKRNAVVPNLNEMEFPSLGGTSSNNNNHMDKKNSGIWSKSLAAKLTNDTKNKTQTNSSKVKQQKDNQNNNHNNNSKKNQNNGFTVLNTHVGNKNNSNSAKKETTTQQKKTKEIHQNLINNNSNMNLMNDNKETKKHKETNNNNNNNNNHPKTTKNESGGTKQSKKNNNNNKSSTTNGTQQKNNITLNSVAKSPNDFTFTSSMGESYNILPNIYRYIPPPEAVERNLKLAQNFDVVFNNRQALDEFQTISRCFRDGCYKPQAFFEHCYIGLKEAFPKLFPELICLLPDINKQQELFLAYQQHLKELDFNERKKFTVPLSICAICKQVLLPQDTVVHAEMHQLYENFPELSGRKRKT